jgi:ribonuclease P protein component
VDDVSLPADVQRVASSSLLRQPDNNSTTRLRSTARLHAPEEFHRVRRAGVKQRSPRFEITWMAHTHATRLGLVVSRRVGNAVVRNRVKRIVREWFRQSRNIVPAGDLVVRAFPGAARCSTQKAWQDLTSLAQLVRRRG